MKNVILTLSAIVFAVVVITLAASELNQSVANRNNAQAAYIDAWGQAQAMIINAKGEAAKDFTLAALPWAVMAISAVFGTVAIIFLLKTPTVRERQIQQLPQPTIIYMTRANDNSLLPAPAELVEVEHERI